ncbi:MULTISPECIES: hypothetical protein [Niastella]|uniref:Uncharacterized protein n=1 Tax=Niastella soli TaxID=2821487 RepID=A0ABS3Z1Q1_9BACT|nr:hypothetical protein [Niastella soli]MBO9203968.1 hypothetical protein [Niastella soli]
MKLLVFLAMAATMPALSSKCNKTHKPDEFLQGKVIRISCASFVVQVTNNDSIGEDGWKDQSNNNASYDNVFAASNPCKLPAGVKAGATIKFKVSPAKANDCITCMMFDAPPTARFDINEMTVVEK